MGCVIPGDGWFEWVGPSAGPARKLFNLLIILNPYLVSVITKTSSSNRVGEGSSQYTVGRDRSIARMVRGSTINPGNPSVSPGQVLFTMYTGQKTLCTVQVR